MCIDYRKCYLDYMQNNNIINSIFNKNSRFDLIWNCQFDHNLSDGEVSSWSGVVVVVVVWSTGSTGTSQRRDRTLRSSRARCTASSSQSPYTLRETLLHQLLTLRTSRPRRARASLTPEPSAAQRLERCCCPLQTNLPCYLLLIYLTRTQIIWTQIFFGPKIFLLYK